jgi:hypothetical protein
VTGGDIPPLAIYEEPRGFSMVIGVANADEAVAALAAVHPRRAAVRLPLRALVARILKNAF